jgi:cell division protein ZapE
MRETLPQLYRRTLEAHAWRSDPAQLRAVERLDDLAHRLHRARRRERGLVRRLLVLLRQRPVRRPVRGLYLVGQVGRGKTWLMDLFCRVLRVATRRSHFHRFMREVHERLKVLRYQGYTDPLAQIAKDLGAEIRVLCFDELYVTDIADAMILGTLFEGLVREGVTLVFTSNVPPDELYAGGLQRERFLHAIEVLKSATELVSVDGPADYRLRELERAPLWIDSSHEDADGLIGKRLGAITGEQGIGGGQLVLEGRELALRRRTTTAAWFDFSVLCESARSQNDYIDLARQFACLAVSGIPVFEPGEDDAARRFIALIDELYDRGVKLIASAAAAPEALYLGERLSPAFARTASRLIEMQSRDYLMRPHRP